jgi:FAD:protein FMN transferase
MSVDRSKKMSRREALRITAVAGLSLAFGGAVTASVLRRAGLHRVSETRTQLGTRLTITVIHPEPDAAHGMVSSAFDEIARLESIFSRYQPETPVARLNRHGILLDAPDELTHVVTRALEYSRLTDGAFDPTIAPLLNLYVERYWQGGVPPVTSEVEQALSLVDYRRLHIAGSEIRFDQPGMSISLDAIAKGYVVDRTAAHLVAGGAERVMVGAGGDIALASAGSSDEEWQIGIQDPWNASGMLGVLSLTGDCMATSGDYMQAFTEDRLLHHILNPRTGVSPVHTSAVTVVAPTAMDADALATATFVLEPEAGLALLERLDGVEGMVVTKDRSQLTTRGFSHLLG